MVYIGTAKVVVGYGTKNQGLIDRVQELCDSKVKVFPNNQEGFRPLYGIVVYDEKDNPDRLSSINPSELEWKIDIAKAEMLRFYGNRLQLSNGSLVPLPEIFILTA